MTRTWTKLTVTFTTGKTLNVKLTPKLVSIDPDKQYLDVIYKVIIEEDGEVWTKVAYCKLNRLYKSVKNAVERIIINGTVPYLQ